MNSQKTPLRQQILLAMILLAFIPLLIMAYQGYHCARMAVVSSASLHVESILDSQVEQINRWTGERRRDMRILEALLADREFQGSEAKKILSAFCKNRTDFEEILILEGDATRYDVLLRFSTQEEQHELPDQFLRELASSDRVVFSPVHRDKEELIALHAGLPLGSEGEAKYLVAILDLSHSLSHILGDQSGLGSRGKTYIVGDEVQLVGKEGGVYALQPTSLNRALIEEGEAYRYSAPSGEQVLGAFARTNDLNWKLLVEVDEDSLLGWISILRTRAILTGVVVLVLATILSFWFARRLASPFRLLSRFATAMTSTVSSSRIQEGQMESEEALALSKSLNSMLDRLENEHRKSIQSASLAAIGELTASIVHEMRNPLSSVKLNINALKRKVRGERRYEELGRIAAEQTNRLERMLSDLLAYGKPISLHLEAVGLDELTEQAIQTVEAEALAKKIAISVHGDVQNTVLLIDREQALRAVTNLLLNAIAASPSEQSVSCAVFGDSGKVVMAVHDHGPGLAVATLERLFDPFFTTKKNGTGLGLSNVRKIMRHHGGTVIARNDEEGGAVFELHFPCRKEAL